MKARHFPHIYKNPQPGDTEKARQFIASQRQLLDSLDITYSQETITELEVLAEEDPDAAVWGFDRRVDAILDGKRIALDEMAYAKAVTGSIMPLKFNESAEAVRYFEQFTQYRKLAGSWSDRIEYVALLGKAFVRSIKPRMAEMGIYGKPDMIFLANTAIEMIEEIPEARLEQLEKQYTSYKLFLDTRAYLERVYHDWVSANTITDDVTLVAFKV